MINIKEFVEINEFTTFKIGGKVRYFCEASSLNEIIDCLKFSKNNNIKVVILGGGSNIVFSDGVIDIFIIKINLKLFNIERESENYVYVKSGAGEIFDNFIKKTVEINLAGLESLSGIPGTVGATPVQNVGAYGAEVSNLIEEVEVINKENMEVKILKRAECHFSYRDSIFKSSLKNKYIIISVTFKLSKVSPSIPDYKDVVDYFSKMGIVNPSLKEIREAVIYIRSTKLPDWRVEPNVGSFFENPIVSSNILEKIKIDYPDVKYFKVEDNKFKIPAGWLIDKATLKGKNFGNISVHDKNALVLVNNGHANIGDLIYAKDEIVKIIKNKFGISLEQEPEII